MLKRGFRKYELETNLVTVQTYSTEISGLIKLTINQYCVQGYFSCYNNLSIQNTQHDWKGYIQFNMHCSLKTLQSYFILELLLVQTGFQISVEQIEHTEFFFLLCIA